MVLCSLNRTFAGMKQKWILITLVIFALTACTSPDHEAMRQRLKYVSDCNRADTVFTERWLPTVDSLVTYFDRHGAANDRMIAHYVQGRVYHDMGEAPQALECYQRAAEQADTTRRDCDFLQLSRICAQTAHLFLQQNLPKNAMLESAKAGHYAMIAQDSVTYISCIVMESMAHYELQQYNEAMLLGEEVFRYNLERKDSLKAYIALRQAILSALKADNITIADKWLTLYEDSSGLVDRNSQVLKGHELYYALKGTSCLGKNNNKQAEFYFQALLASTNNLGMRARAYQGLYETYRNLHHLDSMAKYAVLYSQYNDSTTNALRSRDLQQQASLYNYSHSQEMSALMSARAAKSQRDLLLLMLILVAFFITISSLFLFYGMMVKSKIRKVNFGYFGLLIRYLHEQMKLQLLLDSDKRDKNAIEGQLSLVDSLKLQMAAYHDSQLDVWEVDEMLLDSPVVLRFHELAAMGKSPDNKDWIELRKNFNLNLPSFLEAIGNLAEIGIQETNVCILVKLHFVPSEICTLLNMKPQALTNIRTRLLLKLFGKHGGAKDFDKAIQLFSLPNNIPTNN